MSTSNTADSDATEPTTSSGAIAVGTSVPAAPPPELLFRYKVRLGLAVRTLWRYRELVRTLAERDFRSRYKQALLGAGWAVVTPVVMMIVFTVFFKRVAKIDTGDVPYPLFSYVGLIPWSFFSSSVSTGGLSLATNSGLLNKLYCPREVFPLSGVAVAAFDALVATSILGVLFIGYGFLPQVESIWVPVLLLIQLMFTLGFTFAIAGMLVYFRDLRQTVPILLQLGLFATPVAWGFNTVPASYRWIYALLNPLAPVIDGYRRTVLYGEAPQLTYLALAAGMSLFVLVSGYFLLKRLEVRFADVA